MSTVVSDLTDVDLDITEQGDRIIAKCAAQVFNSKFRPNLLQNCLNRKMGFASTGTTFSPHPQFSLQCIVFQCASRLIQ